MRIIKIVYSILVFCLCIIIVSCIKQKNLYDDSLAEKNVISNPEFLYPFRNEPMNHNAEITIHLKKGIQLLNKPTAVIPPIKYNKSLLLMLTQDDCNHSAFCYTWAAIHGKPLSKKWFYDLAHLQRNELPSDCYYLNKTLGSTDGAGKEVRFSFTTTISAEEKWMDGTTKINMKNKDFHAQKGLVWGNVKEMLNFGTSIAFHDVLATDVKDKADIITHYEIGQDIIVDRLQGRGCKMLAEPNGNKTYVEAAYEYPKIKTLTAQSGADKIQPFREGLDLEKRLIERAFFDSHDHIKKDIEKELSLPLEERSIVYPSLHASDTGWVNFLLWLNDTYGKDGKDIIWIPNQEEYYEYNYYKINGVTKVTIVNEQTIKVSIDLPGQEYFYFPSVTVNLSEIKKEHIERIEANDEVTGMSYANYDNGIMINIDCRRFLAEHAENFVKRYEANPSDVSAKADAVYYVSMLKDSDKKEELMKRIK